jgi:hypothetical protein
VSRAGRVDEEARRTLLGRSVAQALAIERVALGALRGRKHPLGERERLLERNVGRPVPHSHPGRSATRELAATCYLRHVEIGAFASDCTARFTPRTTMKIAAAGLSVHG